MEISWGGLCCAISGKITSVVQTSRSLNCGDSRRGRRRSTGVSVRNMNRFLADQEQRHAAREAAGSGPRMNLLRQQFPPWAAACQARIENAHRKCGRLPASTGDIKSATRTTMRHRCARSGVPQLLAAAIEGTPGKKNMRECRMWRWADTHCRSAEESKRKSWIVCACSVNPSEKIAAVCAGMRILLPSVKDRQGSAQSGLATSIQFRVHGVEPPHAEFTAYCRH